MTKRVATDRPLSFEDVGVIGKVDDAVKSDVEAPLSDEQARAQARPADASAPEGDTAFFSSGFDRVEEEEGPQEQRLPDGFENWQSYKLANPAARENFTNVVLFPEFEFIAPGRYVDAQNVDKIFDVMPGEVSPEGLYLFPINYLVAPARDAALNPERGKVSEARGGSNVLRSPRREPDPLRRSDNKE
jgi:hypothetical protein